MLSIKENVNNEIVINKSRFITELIKINNEKEIDTILNEMRKKYPNASHYCYAYICGSKKKYSDDGEPSKTAGAPILNVLESNDLDNILGIVIRYFGGIKLGAGGLVRAYTKAITEVLKKAQIINLIEGKKIEIVFNYDKVKQIDYLLTNIKIVDKLFKEKISYTILISNTKYQEFYNELLNNAESIIELGKILIEK